MLTVSINFLTPSHTLWEIIFLIWLDVNDLLSVRSKRAESRVLITAVLPPHKK